MEINLESVLVPIGLFAMFARHRRRRSDPAGCQDSSRKPIFSNGFTILEATLIR